ncbi:MAG: glycosyltransferase [Planctomycetota bacterium]|nr:glycosyltransferase [Planctomycetota bacterium]
MRIALIMDGLGGGGAERQCVLAANELARLGHDVTLISYGSLDYCLRFLDRQRVRFVAIAARGKLRIGRLLALRRVLKAGRFDVAHGFHLPPSIYGGLAAGLAGVPRFFMGFRGQHGLSTGERIALRLLAGVRAGWIVNSLAVRTHVIKTLAQKPETIHVVRNGFAPIDPSALQSRQAVRETLGLDQAVPVVALVGNLRQVKNVDMFLRLAGRLAKAGPDAQFVIAGEGKEELRLKALCHSMGLDARVRFIGFCQDVPSLMGACDVVALTSFSEGLPNVLIEAAMMGVPSVSTDNGGARDVIDDGRTGYVVPVDDDEAMAQRLTILLGDADNRKALGQAAQAYAKQTFSVERMVENLLRVYRGEDAPKGETP